MSKEFNAKADYRTAIIEAVKQIDSQWLLWQIYRTIKNVADTPVKEPEIISEERTNKQKLYTILSSVEDYDRFYHRLYILAKVLKEQWDL